MTATERKTVGSRVWSGLEKKEGEIIVRGFLDASNWGILGEKGHIQELRPRLTLSGVRFNGNGPPLVMRGVDLKEMRGAREDKIDTDLVRCTSILTHCSHERMFIRQDTGSFVHACDQLLLLENGLMLAFWNK